MLHQDIKCFAYTFASECREALQEAEEELESQKQGGSRQVFEQEQPWKKKWDTSFDAGML